MDKHFGSLRTIKEEPKESNIERKIQEVGDKLKSTLSQIKSQMEKLSIKPKTTEDSPYDKGAQHVPKRSYLKQSDVMNSNDSALSSFHNHNLYSNLKHAKSKEDSSGMERNDNFRKTTSTEGLLNSKDNFFKNKTNNESAQSNNFKMERNNSELEMKTKNEADYPDYLDKGHSLEFSGQNFNKKLGTESLSNYKKELDSDNEFSDLENRILDKKSDDNLYSGTFKSESEQKWNNGYLSTSNFNKTGFDSNRNSAPEDVYSFKDEKDQNMNASHKTTNSNLNTREDCERTKRYLKDFLSDLEKNKQVKLDIQNNKWVLDFDYDGEENQTIAKQNETENLDKPTRNNTTDKFKNTNNKKYYELKNQIEILKKEKQNLQSIIKETPLTRKEIRMKNINNNFKTYTSNSSKHESNYKSENSDSRKDSSQRRTKLNMHHSRESLEELEERTLQRIKDEDIFEYAGYKREDPLGEFIDRVIDRSLYVYKNRNCHTCSRLLSTGKSTKTCPKRHHII